MSELDLTPFVLSLKLASLTTLILFFLALPLAWWLSQTKSAAKPVVETVTALPLVLPPTVLGFYLLWAFSGNSALGGAFEALFGAPLAFSFEGIVFASVIYAMPFMVQPLQNGFESLNPHMIEASYLAGKGKLATLWRVALPNIKPSLITALVITFAHTIGEFGVVLMVGGAIPGETRVASVAVYDLVEQMEYDKAHLYAAILLGFSFVVLLVVYWLNRRSKQKVFG